MRRAGVDPARGAVVSLTGLRNREDERTSNVESEQDKQENAQPQAEAAKAAETAPESSAAASDTPAAGTAMPASLSRRRVFIGLGVAAVVIIGAALAMQRTPGEPNTPGSTVAADITLITSDRADVDCAAATGVGSFNCAFSDESMPRNNDEKDKLKPFYTTDRKLYLIPGLFLQPALQERFKSEPPDKPRDLLKRFTAKCNLKILGKVGGVKVRWLATGAWSTPEETEVASVVDCKVEG
jgi:hypothetical protein